MKRFCLSAFPVCPREHRAMETGVGEGQLRLPPQGPPRCARTPAAAAVLADLSASVLPAMDVGVWRVTPRPPHGRALDPSRSHVPVFLKLGNKVTCTGSSASLSWSLNSPPGGARDSRGGAGVGNRRPVPEASSPGSSSSLSSAFLGPSAPGPPLFPRPGKDHFSSDSWGTRLSSALGGDLWPHLRLVTELGFRPPSVRLSVVLVPGPQAACWAWPSAV